MEALTMDLHPAHILASSRLVTRVFLAAMFALSGAWAHAQAPSYAQAQQALQAGQYTTAFQAFQALAREGDAASQFQLSLLYRSGRGVAPNAQQALQWLQRAAQGRNAEALSNLGGEYARGQSVRQDKVKALALFLLAQALSLIHI